MSQVEAGRRVAAALAALLLCACPGALLAQEQPPPADPLDLPPLDLPPLDPSAPLDPLPDLGVDWPDMEQGADDVIADAPDAGIADSAAERRYTVRIEGLDGDTEAALREPFDSLSTLARNLKDPANAAQIDRRAREDAELLAELLRARGYYDALVRTRVESAPVAGQVVVTLEAEPGPVYRFSEVGLPGIEGAGEDSAALRDAFGVASNAPVDAARVTAGESALRVELGKRGYAFAEIGSMDIALDHETRTATLTLPVDPNGARRFGRITVEGRPLFSPRHLQEIARWKAGAPYEAALVEDLRRALIATGLVSTVAIRPVAAQDRSVDLAVSLERAPIRTVAGQAGYGTGEGVRIEASWQHRNLLPPEGAVTFRGVIGTQEQLIGAVLRRNNFLRRDQVLTAQFAVSNIDRAAYDARTTILSGAIERQTNIIWQKKWTWSAGAELVATDERDVDLDTGTTRRRTFFIGALPASLSYDGSNDLLDPTTGYRLALRFSPEASLQSGAFGYARTQIDASLYQPFTPAVTLAARIRLGTILGAERDRIAPSRRFYAGGGGSVRGYGFQRLGPRDPVFDDPIGGRSVTEFALEARIRWGNWGIVPFLDGGNISTSPLPRFDDLRFCAGVGVRYHTRFGPIRVDVGTPLNPRSGDGRVAVYVSLGQAF
ncbi:MAG TPA: BamA/TamA family outer membrane protein [Allosphingosinicella sp.]|nr:BamA/TamA family outer membrane protein [Allosphingosinicella sp.]